MSFLEPIEQSLLTDLVGQSELIFEQAIDFQLALAQDPNAPIEILKVLVARGEESVASVAAMHVNYAGELTSDWLLERDSIFKQIDIGQNDCATGAARNDRLAAELLKIGSVPIQFMSKWMPPERLIEALENPYLTKSDRSAYLERLASEATLKPRLIAAQSRDTPLQVLSKLLADPDSEVSTAARNNLNNRLDVGDRQTLTPALDSEAESLNENLTSMLRRKTSLLTW